MFMAGIVLSGPVPVPLEQRIPFQQPTSLLIHSFQPHTGAHDKFTAWNSRKLPFSLLENQNICLTPNIGILPCLPQFLDCSNAEAQLYILLVPRDVLCQGQGDTENSEGPSRS